MSAKILPNLLAQAHGAASELIQPFDWAEPELVAAALVVGLPLVASLIIFLAGKTMWRGGGAVAIALAAAEAAVGLAILIPLYRHQRTVDVTQSTMLRW